MITSEKFKFPSYQILQGKTIRNYNLALNLEARSSLRPLEMTLEKRNCENQPLIYHWDRGLKSCSNEYQKLLRDSFIDTGMSENTTLTEMS